MSMFQDRGKLVIAALHLPPLPGTPGVRAWTLREIEHYAVRNAHVFQDGGVDGIYLQTMGDGLSSPGASPDTIAYMAAIGRAVRAEFDGLLGILLANHGAEGPIAVADATGADFVRLKVYVGAMVKAEGIVQGCAGEALRFRERIGAHHVQILADVYDRTGIPLGAAEIDEAADWAARFCHADGLVLTGRSFTESMELLSRVRQRGLGVPLFLGGGATAENAAEALRHADGIIVSTSLKRTHGTAEERLQAPWDVERITEFMASVHAATQV